MLISDGILEAVASGRSCNLKTLTLRYCSLDFNGIKELGRILEHVQTVDLSDNTLSYRHMQHICAQILACTGNNYNINFQNCSIDVEGMRELARSIHLMEKLDLSDNKLTVSHINHFSTEILSAIANSGSCKLKNVNLTNCSIDIGGIKELSRCLHLVEEVNLSRNKLTVNHVRHISEGILAVVSNEGRFALKIVNLSNCLIDVACIKELVHCLHILEEVNLGRNKLTVNHVKHMSYGILRADSNGGRFSLKKVDLNYCSLDAAGIKELARCLHLIERVDLYRNKLNVDHIQHISDGILAAVSNGGRFALKMLDLTDCSIDVAGIKELARSLHLLQYVFLGSNKFAVNHIRHISDGILAAVSNGGSFYLRYVSLTNCSIDVGGIKELSRSLYLFKEVKLSRNKLTVNHVRHISDGVLTAVLDGGSFYLRNVNLTNCFVDIGGIKELARCLHLVQNVNLSGNKLTVNHVQHISDGILAVVSDGGSFYLRNVNLTNCSIDVGGIKALARCLHLVKEVNISGNKLTVNQVQHMSDGILTADSNGGRFSLKKVDLSDCSLDAAGIKELARCLHLVEEVNLGRNKLPVNQVQHMSYGILTADSNGGRFTLKKLDLSDCSLEAAGIKELARSLHLVEEVNLGRNKLTVNQVQHMSYGILTADSNGGRFTLKKVDLSDCSLDAAGIKELARCLHLVEKVNLSGNILTVNHVQHMSDGILRADSNGGRFSLKKVDLNYCSLDAAGIKELARCLHLVEEVNLSGNKLTVNNVQHISDEILAVVSNGGRFALKKVDLSDCSLDAAGIKELARCLHLIERVDLYRNKLNVDHIQHISDGILAAVSNGGRFALKMLDLTDCSIDVAGIKELARSLHLLQYVFLGSNKLAVNHIRHISDGILAAVSNGGSFYLRYVSLTNCSIDVGGIKELSRCLYLFEEVNLSRNKLTVNHIRHISDGILTAVLDGGSFYLRNVNLTNCFVDIGGIKELTRCLHLVQNVNLSGNKLTVNHVQHISDGILAVVSDGGSFYLRKVNLANCSIDVGGIKALARCLHLVKEVNLSGNKLTVNQVQHMSDGILTADSNGGRFSLKKLDLSDCSLDAAGIKELARSLHLVEEVNLGRNKLTVNHVQHMSYGILTADSNGGRFTLKKVDLSDCSLDAAGIKELARCLHLVEKVNLSGNILTVNHIQHMSDGILRADSNGGRFSLKNVDLNYCSLDAAGIKELARCLHLVEEVNLSGNKLTVNNVQHISDEILAVVSNGGRFALKKVDLSDCSLDAAGIKELARCLHLVEKINLSGNILTVNHVQHMSDGILRADSNAGRFVLKKVDLKYCSLDAAGSKELARCLHIVEEVNLTGNKLTVNHVQQISDGILTADSNGGRFALKKIHLTDCSLDAAGFKELARCLHLVEEVNLSGNKLTVNQVQHMSDGILRADSNGGRFALKKVDLNCCSLDVAGVKELARCLHLVEEVNLSGNKLTVNHVRHISDGILRADSNGRRFALKKVDLNDCSLDAAGIKELARCLHLVEKVNLSGNKLTVNHVQHMSDGILRADSNGGRFSLKKVDLNYCSLDAAGIKELARCLHLVEKVNLSGNKLTVNHVQHMSDGILRADSNGGRFSLKKVDLNYCSLEAAGIKELARCLHHVEEVNLSGNKLTVNNVQHISDEILAVVSN